METLKIKHTAKTRLAGKKGQAIIGVVASGNLEVLLERVLPDEHCEVDIATTAEGFDDTWKGGRGRLRGTALARRAAHLDQRWRHPARHGLPAPDARRRADGG